MFQSYLVNTQQIVFNLNLQTKYLSKCDLRKNTTMKQMVDLKLLGEIKTWNMILNMILQENIGNLIMCEAIFCKL